MGHDGDPPWQGAPAAAALTAIMVVVGAVLCFGVPALGVLTILRIATAPSDPSFRSLVMLFVVVPGLFVICCFAIDLLARARASVRGDDPLAADDVVHSAIAWALVCGVLTVVAAVTWFAPTIFPGVF